MKKRHIILFSGYALFIIVSLFTAYPPGITIGKNFISFGVSMLKVLPAAFILIGLFDVWVKKETIEKHLGSGAGPVSYFWILLLAGSSVGGIYVSLPVSAALYRKGAALSVIFAYLTASAVFRIPMCIFESTFLGLKFTLLRFAVSLPLIILSSRILARITEKSPEKDKIYPE